MAKNDNLKDFLTDVADAIREKKGTEDLINPQDFSDEIKNLPSGSAPRWTGHADVEGLKAIGWDDDDIAFYQQYGVNWNEEDDEYHKVSDDNKALYGVLTTGNIASYKNIIVYLPKIDLAGKTNLYGLLSSFYSLVAIPKLDTSEVTNMGYFLAGNSSLVCIPPLDTSKVNYMAYAFSSCPSLLYVSELDTKNVTDMSSVFYGCSAMASVKLNTSKVINMNGALRGCYSLVSTNEIDAQGVTNIGTVFNNCYSLVNAKLKNLTINLSIPSSALLSKESVLFMIQNEAATSAIVITLHADAYARAMADSEITEALAAHPNVSLASA